MSISDERGETPDALHRLREEEVDLSVVVPVYGCAVCLEELTARLSNTLKSISPNFEIVYVDDMSRDGAWPILRSLVNKNPHVRAIQLSRNFGQHAAITAGLAESLGCYTAVIDCDLQDPPEELAAMFKLAQGGVDVVLARRRGDYQSLWRLLANKAFFAMWRLAEANHGEMSTMSVVSRPVVDAFLRHREVHRRYLSILYSLGFTRKVIEYDRKPRPVGRSSYSLLSLTLYAIDGMLINTGRLLYYVVAIGLLSVVVSGLYAAYIVAMHFLASPPLGFASIIVSIMFVGSVLFTMLSILGIYLGKIFEQTRHRPLYIIGQRLASQPTATQTTGDAAKPPRGA